MSFFNFRALFSEASLQKLVPMLPEWKMAAKREADYFMELWAHNYVTVREHVDDKFEDNWRFAG